MLGVSCAGSSYTSLARARYSMHELTELNLNIVLDAHAAKTTELHRAR